MPMTRVLLSRGPVRAASCVRLHRVCRGERIETGSSRTGGGGPKLAQDADLGQKREPVWDAPVLDYSPVDYPGCVDDVDRDALMGRFRAHHRAFVGAARGGPDPCGPVDTGRVLNGEGKVREPAPKVQDCGFHVRYRLWTAALDAELVLHEVGCNQLIDD